MLVVCDYVEFGELQAVCTQPQEQVYFANNWHSWHNLILWNNQNLFAKWRSSKWTLC